MAPVRLKKRKSNDGSRKKRIKYKTAFSFSTGGIQSACLSEGQRVDMKVFSRLWELGKWSGIRYVIADKGYDYSAVHTPIKKAKRIPVIPRRANAIFPGLQDIYKPYYRTRSAIERFFGRIKENKRLAL